MKKLVCIILCLSLLPVFCLGVGADSAVTPESGDISVEIFPNGDFNGDRKLDQTDAELYIQYAAGWPGVKYRQKLAADVTGDGKVDGMDAILIQQRMKWGSKVVLK